MPSANSRDLWYPKATESKASPVCAGALGLVFSLVPSCQEGSPLRHARALGRLLGPDPSCSGLDTGAWQKDGIPAK